MSGRAQYDREKGAKGDSELFAGVRSGTQKQSFLRAATCIHQGLFSQKLDWLPGSVDTYSTGAEPISCNLAFGWQDEMQFDQLARREFITLRAALQATHRERAAPDNVRHVRVLMGVAEHNGDAQPRLAAFKRALLRFRFN